MKKPKAPPKKPAPAKGGGTAKGGGRKRGLLVTSHSTHGQRTTHKTGGKHPAHGGGSGTGTLTGKKKPKAPPKKRQWSPGSDVACCSHEALGFLLGWDAAAVLDLYWSMCSDPDEGASIADTLAAAWVPAYPHRLGQGVPSRDLADACVRPLILGLTLPDPHAVAVTPDGTWHSWGEPFDPTAWPELVVEEAWELCAG